MNALITQNQPSQPTLESSSLQADIERLEALAARMSWNTHRQRMAELEHYNLTLPQFVALKAIHCCDSGSCNMSELAELVQQVPATMTGIVDRLAQRGLVSRSPNPADRRSFRITLTETGAELVNKIISQKKNHLASFAATLSPEERCNLITMMERMLDHLHRADGNSSS
jgi:DNA-binding MarR family transcriptional regulator